VTGSGVKRVGLRGYFQKKEMALLRKGPGSAGPDSGEVRGLMGEAETNEVC